MQGFEKNNANLVGCWLDQELATKERGNTA